MSNPFEWPALQGERPPDSLDYERGVWGKAHGATTDFRWIARSADFGRDPGLHQELSLGGEDVPISFQAWRNAGDCCYAVTAYPSRAIDAAGRRGFLEKQVLEWRRPESVPAALGALLLLPQVARMTDEIWWDSPGGELWSSPERFLSIVAEEHRPLVVDERSLASALQRGRRALQEAVDAEALANFYEQLLSSGRPAFLAGLRTPLPPEALAALLLPLPRAIADRISIAGWIPTSRPVFADLANRWDAVVTPRPATSSPAVPAGRQAVRMAQQLLADEQVPEERPFEWIAAKPKDVSIPVAPNVPVVAKVVNEPRKSSLRPMRELDLQPPERGSEAILFALYEFARAANRRWLTPEMLKESGYVPCFSSGEPAARLLLDWVQHVRDRRPGYADVAQWQVKVDLLRSATFVLVPECSTLREAGLPDAGSRVPALLFALMLDRNQSDRLGELGTEALADLLDQSFRCEGANIWAGKLRRWLDQWEGGRRHEIREVIRKALNSRSLAP